MNVLGISCWYHDAAACLLQGGRITAAAQEERFTRNKHDPSFPRNAIAYCLREGGIQAQDLDIVAFYDKPFLKFERLLETYLSYAPKGLRSFLTSMPVWLKRRLWIPDVLRKELDWSGTLIFSEHHLSHAASAFFPSPFERAAFLTTDGVGEWTTTSFGTGAGNELRILAEVHFPHSLGLLYSAFTAFCGFRVNSGEYKLMGLAPYGRPSYVDTIKKELIDLKEDGSFRLNMDFFSYPAGLTMTGAKFAHLFGGPARLPETAFSQREMDLARSVQQVIEEAIGNMARYVREETQESYLCLAGGVALNCVANGKVLRSGLFDRLWIQPAAGDAGGALGSALMAWHVHESKERAVHQDDAMQGAFLGPAFSDDDILSELEQDGIAFECLDDAALVDYVATLLAAGKVVGWFQGRMEYGPRALGSRSILADPRGREVQRRVNLKIKYRESFRPFAPSVPVEDAGEWFAVGAESPYMLLVGAVRDAHVEGEGFERLRNIESRIPAVTHVDATARVQTVHRRANELYWRLLKAFEMQTGCPVLVNTSFNVRGEPIVCTPRDALTCFRRTHMDVLVMGRYVVMKGEAGEEVFTKEQIRAEYGLD